jgi:hypothetical protein
VAQDILQSFLTARLFDLGGDDTRLQKLRDAATDLAAVLKTTPSRVPAFVMVGVDAKVSPDEPILKEVTLLVEKKWNSYIGAFAESALPVVMRGVILEAIAKSIGSDTIALAVSLTARSVLPRLGSLTDEALWRGLIDEAETRLEQRARLEWALPSATALDKLVLNLPEIPAIEWSTVKPEWLTPQFAAAAGPTDVNGNALPNANTVWPNSADPWSHQFAPLAAKATIAALDVVSKSHIGKINEHLKNNDRLVDFGEQISTALGGFLQKAVGLERRTSLIWWKEALYSSHAETSYRSLPVGNACAWIAVDAADITGPFALRMAEAVIAEAIRTLLGKSADTTIRLTELLRQTTSAAGAGNEKLQTQFSEVQQAEGRTQLASLLREPDVEAVLPTRLGLSADAALSPIEFAHWLYRDIQVARATFTPSKSRKKAAS